MGVYLQYVKNVVVCQFEDKILNEISEHNDVEDCENQSSAKLTCAVLLTISRSNTLQIQLKKDW